MTDAKWDALISDFRAGKRRALARAISVVEGERPGSADLLKELLSVRPEGRRIGITGPPGAGKSSLVAALAGRIRERGEEVGIVAVDPTSPYSGGALLGDRIRMNDLSTDPGIFIRSMATRGSLGGLAAKTKEAIDLMDAFGFPHIIVETVGVGQTELEITSAADTVVVVLVPESGDSVQAMKAGLMEIADIFVVNKSDRPGADRLMRDLSLALHLRAGPSLRGVPAHHGVDLTRASSVSESAGEVGDSGGPEDGNGVLVPWETAVLKTSAGRGEGFEDLEEALHGHRAHLVESGELEDRRKSRSLGRIRDVLQRRLSNRGRRVLEGHLSLDTWVSQVASGEATAYSVVEELVKTILVEE
ncbi:MAG: methylmalonyl Co-A mutase-associated GTPase MeaB [Longimicrobiales bacterium]